MLAACGMCSKPHLRLAARCLLPALLVQLASGQGSLTPSGPPGPTQKTLAQIEPRRPLESIPSLPGAMYFITDPGSYYLTGNIVSSGNDPVIRIAAPNVTIDLNGYAIMGVANTGDAIFVGGLGNAAFATRIMNGSIHRFAGCGIRSTGGGGTVYDLQISNVAIDECGQAGIRVTVGATATIRNVSVQSSAAGIQVSGQCTVSQCQVANISASGATVGISATQVLDSAVSGVASSGDAAVGIAATVVSRCRVRDISGAVTTSGISATAPATVNECSVSTVTSTSIANGITGQAVSQCAVSTVSADFSAYGIAGGPSSVIVGCSVDQVSGPGPFSAAIGIVGDKVSTSTVTRTGATGPAILCAIQASDVSQCRVTGLGNPATSGSGTSYGIDAGYITDCSADNIGGNSPIRLELLRGTYVTNCRIGSVSVASFATLINASTVRNCSIYHANSGSLLLGISGQRIEGCDVSNLSADNLAIGIQATQVVNSRVAQITSIQTAIGILARSSPTSIQGCSVHGSSHLGIMMGIESGVVRDCELHGAVPGNMRTVGINTESTNGHVRLENNHVTRFSTGISAGGNTGVYVLRNTVGSCPTPYNLGPGVQAGPLINSGAGVATTSPWANFTF